VRPSVTHAVQPHPIPAGSVSVNIHSKLARRCTHEVANLLGNRGSSFSECDYPLQPRLRLRDIHLERTCTCGARQFRQPSVDACNFTFVEAMLRERGSILKVKEAPS
jgi:hypothetical protein